MTTAKELADETKLDLSKDYKLGDDNLAEDLTELETSASTQAGVALGVLKTEIAPSLDPCLSGYHPHPLYVVCLLGLQARAGAGALRRRSG